VSASTALRFTQLLHPHEVTTHLLSQQPKAAFLPLFNLDEPVKAGEVVLATSLTAGALDSSWTHPDLPRAKALETFWFVGLRSFFWQIGGCLSSVILHSWSEVGVNIR